MATAYLPVCTTNLQIPQLFVAFIISSFPRQKTPSRSQNFLDFDVYVVFTPCPISSRSVSILIVFVNTSQHCAQKFDRQSALRTSQKEKNERIPFTLTYHPHNLAAKNIILMNFKSLQNDSETGRIFSQPPLISFKRDKNIGNFLVKSVLKSDDQPGTFKCARKRCNTCPFIHNADKIPGPKRSIKITDRFTCTFANVIYCITCTLCKKIYIGKTGRRLGHRFREHLRDVERNDKDASKPVARHFNLPNHSSQHMTICV